MASLAEHLTRRRTGVVLSSAFFGFYAHAGFMSALFKAGVKPNGIGGSSAGALVGAFSAAGYLDQFIPVLNTLRRKDFWDPGLPGGRPWGLLKGRRFSQLLETNLPVQRFEDCHTPLLTVSTNLETGRRHVDTTGALAPAVAASCALPFMFRAVVRDGDRHIDGGVIDKAPIEAMVNAFDLDAIVVHFIPSKTVGTPAPKGPRKFLDWALDISRDVSWQTQAALAEALGIEVYVVTSPYGGIGPFSMKRGAQVINTTQENVSAVLATPQETTRFAPI